MTEYRCTIGNPHVEDVCFLLFDIRLIYTRFNSCHHMFNSCHLMDSWALLVEGLRCGRSDVKNTGALMDFQGEKIFFITSEKKKTKVRERNVTLKL